MGRLDWFGLVWFNGISTIVGYSMTTSFFIYKIKVVDRSQGWPEGSLINCYYIEVYGVTTPSPGLLHFTLDPYLIILSVKQSGIKYHFLSLWYDSTWDWTQVSRTIGER